MSNRWTELMAAQQPTPGSRATPPKPATRPPNPRAAGAVALASKYAPTKAARSTPSEPVEGGPLAPEDAALLASASLSPREWRAQELARLGYQQDLMSDMAWHATHETPAPRPAIRPQPGSNLNPLPARLKGAALARELRDAGYLDDSGQPTARHEPL